MFEEQRGALWDKEKKRMAAPVGWTGCGQWEAEAQVRKWEEEWRLEKVTGWLAHCSASFGAGGRVGEQDTTRVLSMLFAKGGGTS